MEFSFYDLNAQQASKGIELLFPGWFPERERVVVFSPHDDDAVIGAGHLIQAAQAFGGEVFVVIFCQGNAGYTSPEERATIVETRAAETLASYALLGVDAQHLIRLDYSDFSVLGHLGWQLPSGQEGTFPTTIKLLRRLGATRLLLPNSYREHIDHEAVGRIGSYDGPQAGDPIVADWGASSKIQSFLEYAVWGDFSPEDALVRGRGREIRANRALKGSPDAEERVLEAIRAFASQEKTIAHLIAAREQRKVGDGVLELYIDLDPRPMLDYKPYCRLVEEIDASRTV